MDGRWQAREMPSRPARLLCGRGLVFATAESENGLLSLWLRRHTTALAFGPCYARCKVLPGFGAVQIQSLRLLQAISLVDSHELESFSHIAAIFPPAVLKVRPPAAREVLGRGATTTIPHRKIADAERGAMPDGKGVHY